MRSGYEPTAKAVFDLLALDFSQQLYEVSYDEGRTPLDTIAMVKKDTLLSDEEANIVFKYFMRQEVLKNLSAETAEIEKKFAALEIERKVYKRAIDKNVVELKLEYTFKGSSTPFTMFKPTTVQRTENPTYVSMSKKENVVEVIAHYDHNKRSRP